MMGPHLENLESRQLMSGGSVDLAPLDDRLESEVTLLATAQHDPKIESASSRPGNYQTAELKRQLEAVSRDLDAENESGKLTGGAVAGLATAIAVGYVAWCFRSGRMAATVLRTLPLWRWLDPLAVLDKHEKQRRKDHDGDEDEQRLRSMME